MNSTEQLANALRVFLFDPATRAYLDANDPKAVEQAERALVAAGYDPKPGGAARKLSEVSQQGFDPED